MRKEDIDWIRAVAAAIDAKKGFNIQAFDISACSSITDCVLIAEGDVPVHVKALMREVEKVAQANNRRLLHLDGASEGDWVVMDYFSSIIHIMTSEMRSRYRLEGIWDRGLRVDLRLYEESAHSRVSDRAQSTYEEKK